jgi:hypothetical protein
MQGINKSEQQREPSVLYLSCWTGQTTRTNQGFE